MVELKNAFAGRIATFLSKKLLVTGGGVYGLIQVESMTELTDAVKLIVIGCIIIVQLFVQGGVDKVKEKINE